MSGAGGAVYRCPPPPAAITGRADVGAGATRTARWIVCRALPDEVIVRRPSRIANVSHQVTSPDFWLMPKAKQ